MTDTEGRVIHIGDLGGASYANTEENILFEFGITIYFHDIA